VSTTRQQRREDFIIFTALGLAIFFIFALTLFLGPDPVPPTERGDNPMTPCELIAPGANSTPDTVDGHDFAGWSDWVSEDGTLDYANHAWTLTHWDHSSSTLGYANEEDGNIWNTRSCSEDHNTYTR